MVTLPYSPSVTSLIQFHPSGQLLIPLRLLSLMLLDPLNYAQIHFSIQRLPIILKLELCDVNKPEENPDSQMILLTVSV